MNIKLFLTPKAFNETGLENCTVVVIDVLRSSTSICMALHSGAKAVIPVAGRGEAGDIWNKIGSENSVLAGEQNGIKIDNFQLGNSPMEFTPAMVKDKFVIMSTTNGTPIFKKAKNSRLLLAAGLVNSTAVAKKIIEIGCDLMIVCAGNNGHYSIEDTLCAGMIINYVQENTHPENILNDAARMSLLLYQTNKNDIGKTIREGEHGQHLQAIGFLDDLTFASEIDHFDLTPYIDDGKLIITP